MKAFDIIRLVDELKGIHQPIFMQEKLNRWKQLAIELDDPIKGFNEEKFIKELDSELVVIESIVSGVKKLKNE